ncbi:MAG: hypothetical protein DRQ62_16030 [Gammaproteobacteria bacterium]|nr:MAG: hypothetical protein DRQ62_16030 [Gammaproteobacteria bacterium]
MKDQTLVKAKERVNVTVADKEVSKASVYTLGAVALAIGAWSIASLISALVTVGPIELVSGFFTAIGMQ